MTNSCAFDRVTVTSQIWNMTMPAFDPQRSEFLSPS